VNSKDIIDRDEATTNTLMHFIITNLQDYNLGKCPNPGERIYDALWNYREAGAPKKDVHPDKIQERIATALETLAKCVGGNENDGVYHFNNWPADHV
jgi:hypothetical protein